MKDLYPSLPPRDYKVSRLLRLLVVSAVLSALVVALLIELIRFLWTTFSGQPYLVRIEFVLPSMFLIMIIIAKVLWDAAEGRTPPPPKGKPS